MAYAYPTIPLAPQEADLAFRQLINTLTGANLNNIWFAYGDKPTANVPYILITKLLDIDIGRPSRVSSTQMQVTRQATYRVNGYGQATPGALQVGGIHLLASCLRGDSLAPAAAGLAIQGVGAIENLTTVLTTSYQPDARITVLVGYVYRFNLNEPAQVESIRLDVGSSGGVDLSTETVATVPVTS